MRQPCVLELLVERVKEKWDRRRYDFLEPRRKRVVCTVVEPLF